MNQLKTIFKKELLESWRNFSWIWVPIVFILLSIMDPITTYYLPVLMDKVGGIPEGMDFEIPTILAPEALSMSLAQISSLGALIIILLTMGTIAGERKSGIAELILVKPVSHIHYITAKWLAKFTLFFVSFTLGILLVGYYINQLFGTITVSELLLTILFYSFWIMFIISLTIFYSTLLKGPGLVAGVTIVTLIAMSIFNSVFTNRLPWFPSQISAHINEMVYSGSISTDLWITAFILIGLNCLLLLASFTIFKNKKITE
ncbi:ABC transporter permease [Amphibacillus sp. Q70]|uniref:ABC transporter permease n=1 Tax=Amphibacillus sp. Q70 TaxID=3453416 RepID=UPI003F8650AB